MNTALASIRAFLVFCVGVTIFGSAAAQNFAINTDSDGIALRGYDAVSYFSDGKPAAGNKAYTAKVDGATYYFSSAEHRDQFAADPAKYQPQFGGYCSYGVTFKVKVDGDPNAWKIVDGKLYIQSSRRSLTEWSQDIPGNIEKANGIWPGIKDVDPEKL